MSLLTQKTECNWSDDTIPNYFTDFFSDCIEIVHYALQWESDGRYAKLFEKYFVPCSVLYSSVRMTVGRAIDFYD